MNLNKVVQGRSECRQRQCRGMKTPALAELLQRVTLSLPTPPTAAAESSAPPRPAHVPHPRSLEKGTNAAESVFSAPATVAEEVATFRIK